MTKAEANKILKLFIKTGDPAPNLSIAEGAKLVAQALKIARAK